MIAPDPGGPVPQILRPLNAVDAALNAVRRKEHLFGGTVLELRRSAFDPSHQKRFERRWPVGKAAEMIGVSRQAIRKREDRGTLPEPQRNARGRHVGYTLAEINRMRDLFGTRPGRAPADEPGVVAFASFKGGAGKSTLSVHFSQYMALKGYRVLFIDCDPQATGSTLFGVVSHADAGGGVATLESFLARDVDAFRDCVQPSYFPGVDLVPSGLELFDAEYRLAAELQGASHQLNDLRDGIRSVWHDYDVVVLDPPPALGMLSLSVLNAANALIVPMRPTFIDFASTHTFLTMLRNNLEVLRDNGYEIYYHFSSLVVNSMDDHKSAHLEIAEAMRSMFIGEDLLETMMRDSAELDNASKEMRTVYDLSSPMVSLKTYRRCLRYLDRLNGEIETRLRRTWPSQRAQLRDEARL